AEDPLRDREETVSPDADQVDVCLPIPGLCCLNEIAIHRALASNGSPSGRRPTLLVAWGLRPFILRPVGAASGSQEKRGNLEEAPAPGDRGQDVRSNWKLATIGDASAMKASKSDE